MNNKCFPVIDPVATGANIVRLRKERGLTVRDLQFFFGFEEPQAIYKWQRGQTLPSVDNLFALGHLLGVPMDEILVQTGTQLNVIVTGQQEDSCCPAGFNRLFWIQWKSENISTILPVGTARHPALRSGTCAAPAHNG